MGITVVNVRVTSGEKSKVLAAVVDTGFMGDLIARPEALKDLDIEFRWEKVRTFANGERVKVSYGLAAGDNGGSYKHRCRVLEQAEAARKFRGPARSHGYREARIQG